MTESSPKKPDEKRMKNSASVKAVKSPPRDLTGNKLFAPVGRKK